MLINTSFLPLYLNMNLNIKVILWYAPELQPDTSLADGAVLSPQIV